MNIAIVIGVSKYIDANNNLPGCENDARAMNEILNKTNKFSTVLYINSNESSAQIKELITNFIAEYKDKTVDEFFFYYSGHGEFYKDEFFYILSDFDEKKRNQTSLQNIELDNLIRNLAPKLLIKVIDACQSGTTYIKDINLINKYFDKSTSTFNDCYFLNSSLNTQSSYQDNRISVFTNSFIKSVASHNSFEIRYKDIIDAILDDFADNKDQTPFFVIQARLTEKFCSISDELKTYLKSLENSVYFGKDDKKMSIYDLVKEDAKEYVSKEGALQSLGWIYNEFEQLTLSPGIADLFELKVTFSTDYKSIPQKYIIGNWLQNQSEYFATPIYEDDYFEDENRNEFPIQVLAGFDLKIDTPYKAIQIHISSKFPNLNDYFSAIIFVITKKDIRFFFFVTNYIANGWEENKLNTEFKWLTDEYKISSENEIKKGIEEIKQKIEKRLNQDIERKYKITNDIDDSEIRDDKEVEINNDDELLF